MTMFIHANSCAFLASHLMRRNVYIAYVYCKSYSVATGIAVDELSSQSHNRKDSHQRKVPRALEKKYDLTYHQHSRQNTKKLKIHRVVRDEVCDEKVKELIHSNYLQDAIATLIRYANVDRYPSKKTLYTLAAMSASERNLEAISKVQIVCKNAYPKEYVYQMEYNHYLAEALWKDGKYKKAITLFHQILLQHHERTKKLSDMITFLTRNLLENRRMEELNLLLKMLKGCVNYGIHQPLANVWQQLFVSELVGQQLMSNDIIKMCGPVMKKFILNKVDTIIQTAVMCDRIDLLQRLIEVVLHFRYKPYYSKVFSALLDHQCNGGHVKQALATFHHMVEEKIVVENQVCSKLMFLLGQNHMKAPEALLKMKYKISLAQTIKYSF